MPAQWTFMVYMAGFNNLTDFATKDLNEMRRVGSTKDVKVAVFIKRLGNRAARHIIVGKNGRNEIRERVGPKDSGDPQTLMDFIRWAKRKAPARRYALTVWNHGSGWQPDDLDDLYDDVRAQRGDTGVTPRELGIRSTQEVARVVFSDSAKEVLALPTLGERAIASDDGSGHSLDTIELGRVLALASSELGGPLALLGMDACLMSTFEVAYQARGDVGAVVGSEELEPGDGWPYTPILRDLTAKPKMTGEQLGQVVVDRYIRSYRTARDQWPVTQAAVRTSQLTEFAGALEELAAAMRRHMETAGDAAKITRAQARSTYFMGDLVDLRSFCRQLRALTIEAEVKDAAKKVIDELAEGQYVIAQGHLGPTVRDCGGVTVYFPPPLGGVSRYYKDLAFAKECGWDDFLRAYQRAVRGD